MKNKYDTSAYGTGTADTFSPTSSGNYLYYNPVDFETFGSLIVTALTTTTTTTTTTATPSGTTTSITLPPDPIKTYNVMVVSDGVNNFFELDGLRSGIVLEAEILIDLINTTPLTPNAITLFHYL